jgi:membrane fusion protein (multidrug efflux system)
MAVLAARDKAACDLGQTTVRAPAAGIISQAASFKVGQYVGSGTPLFSLVDTCDTRIDANVKETQLTNMKRGQKAEIWLTPVRARRSKPPARRSAPARGPSSRCRPPKTPPATGSRSPSAFRYACNWPMPTPRWRYAPA